MAKSRGSRARHETGKATIGKTPYGSHAELVVDHTVFGLTLSEKDVLCEDQNGYYVTPKERLDNGLADPNRWGSKRLTLTKE